MTKNKQSGQPKPAMRCAIYTRTATTQRCNELGISLAAQREAAEAFIASQRHLLCLPDHYDDDGHSGIRLDRPALQRLLADLHAGKIDHLVVYRLDRLTRSLSDLATLLAVLRKHGTALISVTEDLSRHPVLGLKQQEVTS